MAESDTAVANVPRTLYGWKCDAVLREQSLRLCEELAIEEERDFATTNLHRVISEVSSVAIDIARTVSLPQLIPTLHLTGGVAEGFYQSKGDVDALYEILHMVASEDAFSSEDIANLDQSLFHVHTENVSPGHCMLELVKEGSMTRVDPILGSGAIYQIYETKRYLSSFNLKYYYCTAYSEAVKSGLSSAGEFTRGVNVSSLGWRGPAINQYNDIPLVFSKTDSTLGIKMKKWPQQALPWLTRERRYDALSSNLLRSAACQPVFIVPAGSKGSATEDIEWGFAFNAIEMLLIASFNITQRRCYKLLKLLITRHITPLFGDDVISSYCLKTLMFWCIEDSPKEVWQPNFQVSCLRMCLENLLLMVNTKTGPMCPHYFIPSKNLFTGKVELSEASKIVPKLHEMVLQIFDFVSFHSLSDVPINHEISTSVENKFTGNTKHTAIAFAVRWLLLELDNLQREQTFETVCMKHRSVLSKLFLILSKGNCVNELQDVIKSVLSSLGLHCISLCNSSVGQNSRQYTLAKYGQSCLSNACDTALGASLVKLATLYFLRGQYTKALKQMDKVSRGSIQIISGMAPLKDIFHSSFGVIKNEVEELIYQDETTRPGDKNESTRHANNGLDVVYLPGEIHAVPYAIKVEMFKPFREDKDVVEFCCKFYKKWAIIDPMVNAAFLQFLCYMELGYRLGMFRSLCRLHWLCTNTINKVRSSSLNLLGYCYLQMGLKNRGVQTLLRSISLDKENAAYWHLAILGWKEILSEWKKT